MKAIVGMFDEVKSAVNEVKITNLLLLAQFPEFNRTTLTTTNCSNTICIAIISIKSRYRAMPIQ